MELLPCLLLVPASCLPPILGALVHGAAAPRYLGSLVEGVASQAPPVRIRRAAGQLHGAVYLKLMPVASSSFDAFQTQQFLHALSLPQDVSGTPSTITALTVTTDCDPPKQGRRSCSCLLDYRWSDGLCKLFPACGNLFSAFVSVFISAPCDCLSLPSSNGSYCVPLLEASPASQRPALPPKVASGDDLTLSFSVGEGATDVKLYLLNPEQSGPKEIHNGTGATLLRNGSEAVLTISSVSPDWAGKYICRYREGGTLWEVKQEVTVPLVPADVLPAPSQVSMNCSSPDRLTLQCCVRNRVGELRASWNPGAPDPVGLDSRADPLCHFLALDSCPSNDTTFRCTFESDGLGSVHTTVLVSAIRAGDLFCPGEGTPGGWDATKAGQVAERLCPQGSDGKVLRSCSSAGAWGAVESHCTSHQLLSGLHRAQLLQAGLGDPHAEVPWMIDWLTTEATPGQGQASSSPQDLHTVVAIMDAISHVALDADMRLDSGAMTNLLTAANRMLDLDAETEWSAVRALWPRVASGFLQAIENLTSLLLPSPGGFNLTLSNVELQSAQLDSGSVADYSKTFDTEPPVSMRIAEEELGALVSGGQNITITSLVLKKLEGVLPGTGGTDARHGLGSFVMANAIRTPNGSISKVEIGMTFGHWNATLTGKEPLSAQCVFWNHSLLGGVGGWSTQGCQASGTETATDCSCQHLTSFSILMSAHPVPSSGALRFLGNFGLCASILALVATLAIYYLVWTLVVKNKMAYFRYTTLVNISLTLLMGSFWFLGASVMTANHENKLCVAGAFFIHFFYLAMFFWMSVQALMLFHQLIFIFHQLTMSSIVPVMVTVGYGCPLAIAVATVAAFFPRRGYIQEAFCWLSTRSKAIYAFSVPVLAMVTVNILILFVVLLKLMRPSVSAEPPGEEKAALLGIFKALLILTPMFGLTWGLGIITMTTQTSAFTHYAFTILNSFQGVFILLFGCLMDKKVRGALWNRLCKPSAPTRTSISQSKSVTLDSKLSH